MRPSVGLRRVEVGLDGAANSFTEAAQKVLNADIEAGKASQVEFDTRHTQLQNDLDNSDKRSRELDQRASDVSTREFAADKKGAELEVKEQGINDRDLDSQVKSKEILTEYKRLKLDAPANT